MPPPSMQVPDELDTILARLRSGERQPWLLQTAGELAIDETELSVAQECLRRIDPCSDEARSLRRQLESVGETVPAIEDHTSLAEAPAEVVASAFLDAWHPNHLWALSIGLGLRGFLAALLLLGISALSEPWSGIGQATVVSTGLVLLVVAGARQHDAAWRKLVAPTAPPSSERLPIDSRTWLVSALAVCLFAAPLLLGFLAGIGWSFVLSLPSAFAGVFVLVARPLHALSNGFPFVVGPTTRESASILFTALLAASTSLLTALLAWMSCFALIPATLVAMGTSGFIHLASGRLARRILSRLNAERAAAQPFSVPPRRPTTQNQKPIVREPAPRS